MEAKNGMDAVIGKIQKLMALAQRGGTEDEAAAAANKVQELLAAHNLDMAEVAAYEKVNGTAAQTAAAIKRVRDEYGRAAMFTYQRKLWKAVAESNYCWYLEQPVYHVMPNGTRQRVTYHHVLVGREVNVISAKLMGDYLEETINRNCPFKPGRDSSKSWISWKEGCAARLVDRLWSKRQEMNTRSEAEKRTRKAGAAADANTMAISLRDVEQIEHDENYRIVFGEEAYERMMANKHDYKVCKCDRCKERLAWHLEWEQRQAERKPETEAQRRKREAASERYWERERKRQEREWARKDVRAYRAGEEHADSINLDGQVGGSKAAKRAELEQ